MCHTLWDCSAYRSIRAQFLLKLKASLGGSYARFEAISSLDKSSFVLGKELWEEHFESLVKVYIIDIWEERKSLYGDVECAQQPRPHSPTGDLGEIAGVNGQNSEGMCQGGKPGTGKLHTDVAPPTPVGAWSMALGLRQRFEYYLLVGECCALLVSGSDPTERMRKMVMCCRLHVTFSIMLTSSLSLIRSFNCKSLVLTYSKLV